MYNVTLWRFRVTTAAVERQQSISFSHIMSLKAWFSEINVQKTKYACFHFLRNVYLKHCSF
jgi:hypothetical protein